MTLLSRTLMTSASDITEATTEATTSDLDIGADVGAGADDELELAIDASNSSTPRSINDTSIGSVDNALRIAAVTEDLAAIDGDVLGW